MLLKFKYRAWRFKKRVERAEVDAVLKYINPGDTVLDIGANKGALTYWMQQAVGPDGKVVAYEPQPELIAYLEKIKQEMGWANVEVVGAGVSQEDGEMTLFRPDPFACLGASLSRGVHAGGDRLKVPTVSLDSHLSKNDLRPVDFIKCDVEGHEMEVFHGAEAVLREDKPLLMFDCEAQHYFWHKPEDVLEFLYDLGYEGSFFLNGTAHDAADFNSEVHQASKNHESKSYAYSFLFRHRDAVKAEVRRAA